MGTKVEGKSYLPGYFATGDLKGNTTSSWYEEKTLTGHLYDGFMLRPTHGYLEYDKEMLKRTMLEHEAIFRKQVYELHRLYRIQKDLMEEFQKKESYGYSLPADTSQSNSFSSQMPSEGTRRIWQMQHINNAYEMGQRTPMNSDDRRPSNILTEGTLQSCQNETPLEGSLHRFMKKTFDLQLPADEYIDTNGVENLGKRNVAESSFKPVVPPSRICSTSTGNHVSLMLGTGEGPSCRGNKISDSRAQDNTNGFKIVDLNEPVTEILCEEAADSASRDSHAVKTSSMQNQWHHSATWSDRNNLGQRNFFKDRHIDEGTSSNFLDANEELGLNRSFLKKENGKCMSGMNLITTDGHTNEIRILPELAGANSQRTPGILSSDRKISMAWIGQKSTDGIETSGRNYFASSQKALHAMPISFSILQMDHSNTTPPSVSSCAKPGNSISHIPVAVQAPCFNKSTMILHSRSSNIDIEDTGTAAQKWKKNESLTSCSRSGSDMPSFSNGFLRGFPLDSVSAPHLHHSSMVPADLSHISSSIPSYGNLGGQCLNGLNDTVIESLKDVNLNQALPAGFQDSLTRTRDECEESSVRISWLGKRPAYDESVNLESSHDHHQISSYNAVALESESRQEKVLGLSRCNIQGFTSTFQGKESKIQRTEASEDSSTRIFGFPVGNKIQRGTLYSPIPKEEQSLTFSNKLIQKDCFCYTGTAYDMHVTSLDKEIHIGGLPTERAAGKLSTALQNHIDLNDVVPCLDNPKSSEISPESQVVVPVPLSEPSGCPKPASLIDLEEPKYNAEGERFFKQDSTLSSKQDSSQEKEFSSDAFALAAAKNIIAMSQDIESCLDRIIGNPFSPPPPQCDTLQWFAEVVMSNKEHCEVPKEGGDRVSESSNGDESDSFESMTLELEETKIEEYWCRPKTPENKNEEDLGAASLLLGRPRRGQARRRRQRRDFQKDILPGLASLSRHEVSEDLQTIGGLMKASGSSWQTSVTRRGGRNGSQSTRKKQPISLDVTAAEIPFSSAPVQTTKTDINADGSSIIGWGRTTRRCRRQRCPPGNSSAPLT
ncbi:uncharacterized protein [Typha latifolia]|uniref:uncharacterized protein n=1 Tax=Typha latifolia TaxID=4733 RepID=UPI003C2C5178